VRKKGTHGINALGPIVCVYVGAPRFYKILPLNDEFRRERRERIKYACTMKSDPQATPRE